MTLLLLCMDRLGEKRQIFYLRKKKNTERKKSCKKKENLFPKEVLPNSRSQPITGLQLPNSWDNSVT